MLLDRGEGDAIIRGQRLIEGRLLIIQGFTVTAMIDLFLFHCLPRSSYEFHFTYMMLSFLKQATDGEDQVTFRRRNRMTSVSGQELWRHTKHQMEERKINFDKGMSKVQNIAKRYTIKHSQSLRKRAKERAVVIPRRSTMASSAFSEAKRQQLSLKRSANPQDSCRKMLFEEDVEGSATLRDNGLQRSQDFLDGGNSSGALRENRETFEIEMKRHVRDDERKGEDGSDVALEAGSRAKAAEGAGLEEDKAGKGEIQAIWQSVENSDGEEGQDQNKDQLEELRSGGHNEKQESNSTTAVSSQQVKKEGERSSKRVSIIELTETMDV